MMLTQSEIELFYRLWYELLWGINKKHNLVTIRKKPVYGEEVDERPLAAVRSRMWENPQWIEEFVRDSDYGEMNELERGILLDWRKNFINDKFIVYKHLAKYSVFISFEKPAQLYGVCGISNSVKDAAPHETPFVAETVLLPFGDTIIYDSFLGIFNISFGRGMQAGFREVYDRAKKTAGIIETIGRPPAASKPPARKPSGPSAVEAKAGGPSGVPAAMSARYMEIAEIIENFCREKLNAEYGEICLRALAKLCRKRLSPLIMGKAQTWACGIVYAVGASNFIFDKSQPVHMTAVEIAEWFGLAKSTAYNKSAEVTKLLKLSYSNTEFMLASNIKRAPSFVFVMKAER